MKKIPANTEYFHFHNANPKNKITTDCVFRAISTATGKPWKDVVLEMTDVAIKYGYVPSDTTCINKYLKKNGWVKQKQPRHSDGTKYTGIEFCIEHENDQPIIASIGCHHITAIRGGKIWDTWNCSTRRIGSYWTYGEK